MKPKASDSELVMVSKVFVIVYALLALLLAIFAGGRLVALLLLRIFLFWYNTFWYNTNVPGAVPSMFWKRADKRTIGAGLVAGLATIVYLRFFGPGNYLGVHFGL
ncbi:MAG: hypothetical protein ABWW69_07220 [Pyrodictiaceae archaeon]